MPEVDKWNLWHGCRKYSPGCEHCYMYALDNHRGLPYEYSATVSRCKGKFDYPLQKNRQKEYKVKPGMRLMVNMTSDTFIEDADEWRDEMWDIIRQRPDVKFWILTKRADRIKDHLPSDWGDGYENVIMNITCENQEMFDERLPYLLDIPAKHKGLCLAPLLGPIDLTKALDSHQFDEISAGGENYDNPRPCDYKWIKAMSDQCEAYHVNFCFYETGTYWINQDGVLGFYPKKSDQAALAYLSGLTHKYYDVDYLLKDSEGNILPKDVYKKVYNLYHCALCSNRMVCSGCQNCGACGKTEIVDLQTIWEREDELLAHINQGQ